VLGSRRATFCLAAAARAEAIAPTSAPIQVVEKLHAALLGVMKDADKLGYEGRFERLAPVLKETYDTPFMAEKSVGRHWKQATPAEQAELVETFSRFMIANYAGRFDGYSGQSFQTMGEEPSAQGTGWCTRSSSRRARACSQHRLRSSRAPGRSSTCT
jgi:phospholipid transport system substrate-binding protein